MAGILGCLALNLCECAGCMACSCLMSVFDATLAQVSRFGHLLIIVTTFGLAIGLGQSYPSQINGYSTEYLQINLSSGCDPNFLNECIYTQLIYRASFSLFLLYLILAVFSACTEYVNRSFWVLKFLFAIGLFVAFWWGSNSFFSGWGELSRVLSFLWLLVQGLLFLDFAHDIHDVIMATAEEADKEGRESKLWYALYLFLSACGISATIVGLVYLYENYAGCGLGQFFISFTLIMGVLTTVVSLLNVVNKGLLTPCLMFAYTTFMCWYALLSSPDGSCNPTANDTNGVQNVAVVVVSVVSALILLYCVMYGTLILNVFSTEEGSGVIVQPGNSAFKSVVQGESAAGTVTMQPTAEVAGSAPEAASVQSSGTTHERVFFHVLLMLVSCYGAMILTSWGSSNGAVVSVDSRTSNESMWLKIISQWIFIGFYCRVLHVAYTDQTPT